MFDIEQPYGPLIETTVRVASWNVWAQYGPWEARERGIVETLRGHDPDVVILAEAWETDDASQAARLSESLGLAYHVFAGQEDEGSGNRTGIALLSRWPILHHANQQLGDDTDWERVLFAELDGPRGPVQVYGVVLSWKLQHSSLRQAQVRDLASYIMKTQNRRGPVIVAGDFNAVPDSDEIRMLTGRAAVPVPDLVFYDAWEIAGGGGPGHTWSNDNHWAVPVLWPSGRIDYVLSAWPRRGGAGHPVHCEIIGAELAAGVIPSDHYGVLADLRY